jgi:hypothetical protein
VWSGQAAAHLDKRVLNLSQSYDRCIYNYNLGVLEIWNTIL